MASPRHLVSVRGVALVQTERSQVFAFSVSWSDGGDTFVRRSWEEFRQLQKALKETFPVEAGLLRRSERVLPRLYDAPLLVCGGRTGRGLARLRLLNTYTQTLLATGERVARSPVLTSFFAPKPLDLEPTLPASLVILPVPEEPSPCPVDSPSLRSLEARSLRCLQPFRTQDTQGRPFVTRAHESLAVLLPHPSGWWLVENEDRQTAWFPAPYLEVPSQGREAGRALGKSGTLFCSCRAHEGKRADELSVPAGARVRVLGTSDRGWWLCSYGGRAGLLPAVLLRPEGLGALLSGPGILGEDRRAPAVPARPPLSAIQSRCCTITRRALGRAPDPRDFPEGVQPCREAAQGTPARGSRPTDG